MPVVAVAGALAADVFAGAAVAGAVTLSTAATAFAVVGAVGATLGAVGAVTRNKGLQTAGMVIGGIGAVGGLASAAGLFGSATEAAAGAAGSGSAFGGAASDASNAATYGATSQFATDAASGAGGAAGSAFGAAASDASNAASYGGIVDFVNNASQPTDLMSFNTTAESLANPADMLKVTPDVEAPGSAAINESARTSGLLSSGDSTNLDLTNTQAASATPSTSTATAPSVPTSNVTTTATPTTPTAPNEAGFVDNTSTLDSGIKAAAPESTFSKILGFAQKNPLVAYGALQTAGSFLSGATSTLTPAQVNALNAQAAANNAAAALAQQQVRNLAMPKSVASMAPVTGTPQPLVPGLLNNAPRLAPVTGAPA